MLMNDANFFSLFPAHQKKGWKCENSLTMENKSTLLAVCCLCCFFFGVQSSVGMFLWWLGWVLNYEILICIVIESVQGNFILSPLCFEWMQIFHVKTRLCRLSCIRTVPEGEKHWWIKKLWIRLMSDIKMSEVSKRNKKRDEWSANHRNSGSLVSLWKCKWRAFLMLYIYTHRNGE